MKKLMNSVSRGFTLIEVLTVVAILSILSAVAIQQYGKYAMKASKSTAEIDAINISNILEGYFSDYFSYPAAVSNGSSITIGDHDFKLTNRNSFVSYAKFSGGYSFSIYNSKYSKYVVFDSLKGRIQKNDW